MSAWLTLDLFRQVKNILRPVNGGTGSTYGEERVVVKCVNSTGATLALYTLVQLSGGANDPRVKKVAATSSDKVLGVVRGYYTGTGALVEAAAPDGYEVAIQTSGIAPILVESTVTRDEYAFAAATDGMIVSSATVAAGAFGRIVHSADIANAPTADVAFPLTAYLGAGAGAAPIGADYLVGTANATLTSEIVVGTTPGGELGGTWATPTVDATHSGSAHHGQSHDHTGADGTPKITQARSHESPDTDSATSSLHHTVGASSTQAAAGNHTHIGGGAPSGTSFPGSPSAGDLFYRTDLSLLASYDGTRWVTTAEYEYELSRRGDATEPAVATSDIHYWAPIGDAIYITAMITAFFVSGGATGLSSTHKWVITLVPYDSAGSAGSAIATISIDSGSSAVFRTTSALGIDSARGATDTIIAIKLTKTGTPGALAIKTLLRFRRILT